MKRILTLMISIVSLFLILGCSAVQTANDLLGLEGIVPDSIHVMTKSLNDLSEPVIAEEIWITEESAVSQFLNDLRGIRCRPDSDLNEIAIVYVQGATFVEIGTVAFFITPENLYFQGEKWGIVNSSTTGFLFEIFVK